MPRRRAARTVSVVPIVDSLWAGWRAQALVAAIELDVFSHLSAGRRTVGEIAAAAHATPRGIRGLLDALVPTGLIGKRADRYKLGSVAQAFLVKGQEFYLGSLASLICSEWSDWSHLGEAVRTGRALSIYDSSNQDGKAAAQRTAALFPLYLRAAEFAAQSLPAKLLRRVSQILDLSPGSGAWSIAFARALPAAGVTALDAAPALKVTRQFVSRNGLASRYKFVAGDPLKADLGHETYDMVLVPFILSRLGPHAAGQLIAKAAASLRPGGVLLTAGFIPNDVRTGPLLPLLFGLNMLLHSREGDAFTFRQIKAWHKSAGLHGSRILRSGDLPTVVLATRSED